MPFSDTLLAWYDGHRRNMPWRGEQDPYKIWASEIILQQTRVEQGWDYYLKFVETFPDVQTLASASEDEVLRVWQGLGYYSRARNMRSAARQITAGFGGEFPQTYKDIRSLKGVGDYTAAAVASMAFNLPYPAVDGNVMRTVSRIYGLFGDIGTAGARREITGLCRRLMDLKQPGRFNQAMMDFGAALCTPRNPRCEECPFCKECYAFQNGAVGQLPVKRKPAVRKNRYFHYIFYVIGRQTVVEKRDGKDIWRGLYQFPLIEASTAAERPVVGEPAAQLREVLTHQVIHASFYVKNTRHCPLMTASQRFIDIGELAGLPMPKVMSTFVKRL